jgi:hypothetical protein
MNTIKLCLAMLVVLFISCYRPLFEKAEIKEGTTIGFGVGVATSNAVSYNDVLPSYDYCLAGTGTVFYRHGFSEKRQIFIQVSGGTGWWLTNEYARYHFQYRTPIVYDIQAGMKFKIKEHGAIRGNIGFPGVIDLTYLRDINTTLTEHFTIGVRGIGLGLIFHAKLSKNHLGHISINCGQDWNIISGEFHPSLFLGFGIE